ncbi:MAG: hypothetical protein Q7U56_08465 [Humidesulfovibrio sp.]|nr:hypothetical protein [Desulfovibrio sp.]MDO9083302.1 hypothetical protein [Humidesulfovibrio sp.]
MRSWKVWLLVALIFATGVAAGAFGMRAYMARRLPEILAHPVERMEDRILAHIDSEVGLSAAQRAELRPLIAAAVARADAAHQSVRAELESAFTQLDDAIAARLDQGQRVKFAVLRARMEKFRRSMPPGPPPGPPPQQ